MARISKDHTKQIIAIDFSDDGTILVSVDNTMLNIYDTSNGKKIKALMHKTKQISRVKFTHHASAVLCATKVDHQILYWSIHENQVVKIFKGHSQQIECLQMSPLDDYFVSSSRDQTVRLWNLQTLGNICQAQLDLSMKSTSTWPIVNFDNIGLIFIVAFNETINSSQCTRICLYDKSKFEDGAFASWNKDYGQIKIIKFSYCGKYILCSTNENNIVLLDAFEGNQLHKFTQFENQSSVIQCSFSPDSKLIVSGSENGKVMIWETKSGKKINQLNGHVQKCTCVKFSPIHLLLVTAGRIIIWWLPKI